jgi:hypothetical protein
MIAFFRGYEVLLLCVLTIALLAAACSPPGSSPTGSASVPHLEALTSAVSSGSTEELLPLIQFSSLPCTRTEGMGGPPKCTGSDAEGDIVEVLPILGPEGHHMRRSDFSSWPGLAGAELYAVYHTNEETYSDEFFPAGEYGIAFLMPDTSQVVVFQVSEGGVVRIDYHAQPTLDEILRESEVITGPNQPFY